MERRLAAVLSADMAGYSRLMERGEVGGLLRQKAHRRDAIDPEIASRGGRIVKTTGDGLLVEFASVQETARCAIEVQSSITGRERDQPADAPISYRIGISLGDIVLEDGDIFGDGVNVAARLQELSVPGGVWVSDIVHQALTDRAGKSFRHMGSQRVKNISRLIRVWQWTPASPPDEEPVTQNLPQQHIQYATSFDDVQIAWASIGKGAPIFKSPNWLNHLKYDWRSPVWGPFLTEIARHHRLVRFDQRGNGLSDWDAGEISFGKMVGDMAAVANASGLERFALLGISQGCSFSIQYALENPDRVTCLTIFGGFLRGRLIRPNPGQKQFFEILTMVIQNGWGSNNPSFRQFFTSSFIPDAGPVASRGFDELQRICCSTENALRIFHMNANLEVTEMAKRVRVPTLVLHCTGDRVAPIEEDRCVARFIPGAAFVELPGNNHVLLEGTPEFAQFFDEVSGFLARDNSLRH